MPDEIKTTRLGAVGIAVSALQGFRAEFETGDASINALADEAIASACALAAHLAAKLEAVEVLDRGHELSVPKADVVRDMAALIADGKAVQL